MGTASTKRRRKKGAGGPKGTGEARAYAPAQTPRELSRLSDNAWLVASLVILGVAVALRLYALELKPFHHDEGVNGFFLTNLVRRGEYRYDPTNYHGPTLYYFALPLSLLFGLKTYALRLVPVIFGVGTVWLLLCLRRYVGVVGALVAAALVAVSPASVFYSRYFIHETMFVFCALGAVVALVYFFDTGRAQYLMLAAAALALHTATKETAFITVGVLVLATLVAWWWTDIMRGRANPLAARSSYGPRREGLRETLTRLGGWGRVETLLVFAVAVFLVVNVLFYSSFFRNGKGVSDAFRALQVWTDTGTGKEVHGPAHQHPWYTYLKWLFQEESPLLLLGAVGSALALWSGRNRFAVFAGAWAFGTLAAYSLVPYKTPWLVLNFTVPMAIAAGYAVEELVERLSWTETTDERRAPAVILGAAFIALAAGVWKLTSTPEGGLLNGDRGLVIALVAGALVVAWCVWALQYMRTQRSDRLTRWAPALVLAALGLGVSAYQTWKLNFREYDNDRYPYVYAHTRRQFLDLMREVEATVKRAGTGHQTRIAVTAPGTSADSYWPLPWYLNDYETVGYYTTPPTDVGQIPVVIGNATQDAQLRTTLGATHRKIGATYPLRPGVDLILYARNDVAGK